MAGDQGRRGGSGVKAGGKGNEQTPEKPPVKKRAMRATKLEMEYRRRALMAMLKAGFGVPELRQYARETFGLSHSGAHRLVEEVMEAVVEAMSTYDMRRLASTTYMRFEHAYRMAEKMKRVEAMVSALDSIARYWLKTPPEVVITGGHDEDDDRKGDF